jgi:predicted PurR-regulated permease PerM
VSLLLKRLPGDQQSLAGVFQNFPQFVQQLGQASQFQQALQTLAGVFGAATTGLLHLTLALALAFFLYRDGHRLQAWYRKTVGGRDTAAYSYLAGVDADLEVVYFGNVLTVLAVTLGSMVVYNGYNLFAPPPVTLPFPTLLAVLTGLATFVPLVVGKLIYVPATAYLGWRAVQADGSLLVYPAGFLVVVFLLLDVLPQSVVRPYISGQTMHEGAVLFAYILGTALFGWYGLFFGPLLLVVVVQFANVVLEDLVWGRPFSSEPTDATSLGTDPTDRNADAAATEPDGGATSSDDAAGERAAEEEETD